MHTKRTTTIDLHGVLRKFHIKLNASSEKKRVNISKYTKFGHIIFKTRSGTKNKTDLIGNVWEICIERALTSFDFVQITIYLFSKQAQGNSF